MARRCQFVIEQGFDMETERCWEKLPCPIHGMSYSKTDAELWQEMIDGVKKMPVEEFLKKAILIAKKYFR